ncbi:LOW QUALITY PROTEIN: hypothetical protein MKX08_002176 [Trichoderma sp. CBMAI-0020]|nr:LOW QUALITY PROTEIN: hypothetical protein MKX08_002176 [Trichoderma sp. CBMAI-0020]
MDIKQQTFVDDHGMQSIPIGWGQGGVRLCTLAPEADGDWDNISTRGFIKACVIRVTMGPCVLIFLCVDPSGIFPEWSRVGRELVRLRSIQFGLSNMDAVAGSASRRCLDLNSIVVNWNEDAADIPNTWKAVVMSCLEPDPNGRVRLTDFVQLWKLP